MCVYCMLRGDSLNFSFLCVCVCVCGECWGGGGGGLQEIWEHLVLSQVVFKDKYYEPTRPWH